MQGKHVTQMNIGDKWTSKERIITSTEVETFCDISGMRGDAFLADQAARAVGLKGKVVPGALTFAVGIGLYGEVIHGAIHVSTDKMKLISPVYHYDKISAEVEVTGKRETSKGDRVFVSYTWNLRNQDGTVVAQGENT